MKTISTWKDCRNPDNVRHFVTEHGCTVRQAAGDHQVINAPNGSHFVIYDRELSTGVACKLFKWLKYAGLLMLVGLYLAWQFA
jgi:hypothetical protein